MVIAKRHVHAALLLGAISVMVSGASACRKARPTRRSATPTSSQETVTLSAARTAAAAQGPPVSAAMLLTAYRADAGAADQRYNGQRFLVEGAVAEVRRDDAGGSIFCLATGSQLTPVFAKGLRGQRAAAVKYGDRVTLTCNGVGSALGSPVLEECTLSP